MKMGDLVRIETGQQFPKWFYGIVVEHEKGHYYFIQWFDDHNTTLEEELDLEVINEER